MYIVAALVKDAHQARGLIRALADAAFEREEIDMSGGPVSGLMACECLKARPTSLRKGSGAAARSWPCEPTTRWAEQAALLMNRHGAVDIEACSTGWRSQGWSGRISAPEDRIRIERYACIRRLSRRRRPDLSRFAHRTLALDRYPGRRAWQPYRPRAPAHG